MNELFEENLDKFSRVSSKTALFLPNVDTSSYHLSLTEEGELNLNKDDFYFHSPHGAIKEIEALLKPHLNDQLKTLFIYGVGLGYAYFSAKDWLKKNPNRTLIFLEDDLGALKLLLETERGHEILENEQVRLVAIEPTKLLAEGESGIDGVEVLIESCESVYTLLALPSYSKKKQQEFQKVTEGISSLQYMFAGRLFEALNQVVSAKNFYNKLLELPNSYFIKDLLAAFAGIPSLICGAGPSLVEDLPLLRTLSARAILFGAGTGMNILNNHGIYPHFGGGVDPTDVQRSRIRSNFAYETPFFYTNRFSSSGFEELNGPKIFTPQVPEMPWAEYLQSELGILNSHRVDIGFSTSNFCTSTAVFLGCNPIIYLGMDMSYKNEKKYATGAELSPIENDEKIEKSFKKPNSELIRVKNFEGVSFETTLTFINESAWMSLLAQNNPTTTFIYASTQGLGVNKVARLTLEETALRYCKQQFDLVNQIHAVLQQKNHTIDKNQVSEVLKKWLHSLEWCLKWLDEWLDDCIGNIRSQKSEESWKSAYIESQIEQEPAYNFLLYQVGLSIEIRQARSLLSLRNYPEKYTASEACLLKLRLKRERYLTMKETILDHLFAVAEALKLHSLEIEEKSALPPKENSNEIYAFEKGVLKISDPELGIKYERAFNPILIPQNIKETAQWKSHEPVGEVYAYVNGIREGETLLYYPDGGLKARQYYWEGLLHGPSTFFSRDGKILGQSWFIEGKREGKTRLYYTEGQIYSIQNWVNGMKEGKQTTFYPKGGVKSSMEFSQGLLQGEVKLFYPNGQLKMITSFLHGLKEGAEKTFDAEGNCLFQARYSSNHPVGDVVEFFPDGAMAKKLTFDEHSHLLESLEWNQEGVLLKKETYDKAKKRVDDLTKMTEQLKQAISELTHDKPSSFS